MLIYATTEDLEGWLDPEPAPTSSTRLLRTASQLVYRATINDHYATTGGIPSDPEVRQAFTDATCAQVESWVALGIDPVKGKADPGRVAASKSIGGASVSYVQAGQAEARAHLVDHLTDEAAAILRQAGLGSPTPWSTPAAGNGHLA